MTEEDTEWARAVLEFRSRNPHIAVDFDGTLVEAKEWTGCQDAGPPVMPIVNAVKRALEKGYDVSIFTARASPREGVNERIWGPVDEAIRFVEEWSERHIGVRLPVTATKFGYFTEFWDDRAVGVVNGEGRARTGALPLFHECVDEPDDEGTWTPCGGVRDDEEHRVLEVIDELWYDGPHQLTWVAEGAYSTIFVHVRSYNLDGTAPAPDAVLDEEDLEHALRKIRKWKKRKGR